MDAEHKGFEPKILRSPGIGKNYLNRYDSKTNTFNNEKTKEYYTSKKGNKLALPTYYRNKLYNEDEREKLWLNMIDRNVRYIGGVEVRADDEDLLFNIIEQKRILNKRFYGNEIY